MVFTSLALTQILLQLANFPVLVTNKNSFYQDIAATVPSKTKSNRRKLPVESIRENFNSLINQLQIAQKTLPREKWSKPVTVDNTISINASVGYLFCNDTMRFRRKINLKNTTGIGMLPFFKCKNYVPEGESELS